MSWEFAGIPSEIFCTQIAKFLARFSRQSVARKSRNFWKTTARISRSVLFRTFCTIVWIPYSTDFCRHVNREILSTIFEAKCGTKIEKFLEKISLIFLLKM